MNSPLRAHVYVLLANLIYGLNYSIGKVALQSLPPFGIVLIRVSVCLICFWLIHAIFIKEKTSYQDHKKLIVCAFFGVAANQLLFLKGLDLTSEIHSALIMITTPVLVLLTAWIILKERLTLKKSIGILTGAAGVGLLILSATGRSVSQSSALGDICIMLNAASYAVFLVLAKPLMEKYSPITVTKWIFIYGFFMVLPFGIKEFMDISWQTLSLQAYLSLSYVVVAATILAYLFNILGLMHGNATLVSIYIYTQPVIATIIAVIAQTDTLNITKIISSLLVFAGVALVSFSNGNKRKQHA